ncbi:tetratricopeptide repeat-containing protein kinase family protein [Nocardia sp. NPDC051833]|uniref:tetratricopeptide repeat-containing protein kinase family protein n=1 Tax=Nocardia sp. NPDC051833 TaxID=3155674 RepID=UPI00342DA225
MLTDFGIAHLLNSETHLTVTGTLIATLAFASPEQLSASTIDHRSDQYSLACTMFTLLTGTSPFAADHPGQVITGHLVKPWPSLRRTRADLPAALDQVLTRAASKSPNDRFDSCGDFAAALRRALPALVSARAHARPTMVNTPEISRLMAEFDQRGAEAKDHDLAGDTHRAVELMATLLTECTTAFGSTDSRTLTTRIAFTDYCLDTSAYLRAAYPAAGLVEDCVRVLGAQHAETLDAKYVVARLAGMSGDARRARDQLQALVAIADDVDADTLIKFRTRAAHWFGEAENYAAASDQLRSIVADSLRLLGPDHRRTLETRAYSAHSTGEAGNAEEAVSMCEAVLADYARVLGPEHPLTLDARSQLIRWTGEAGKPAEAVNLYRTLVADRSRIQGPDHPDTLDSRGGLARWTGEAGNPAEAVNLFRTVVADRSRIQGPDHTDTLNNRSWLARMTGEAGNPAEAVNLYRTVVADRSRIQGPDHTDTLDSRGGLARWTGEAGNPAEAVNLYRTLVADRSRIQGPDHTDTLNNRSRLARTTGEAGDPTEAVNLYRTVVADRSRIQGPDHTDTLNSRGAMARWTGEAGNPAEAAKQFQTLTADRSRIQGPDHTDTLDSRWGMARWTGEAGNTAEAAKQFQTLAADYTRVKGPDESDTLNSREWQAYWTGKALDAPEAAKQYRQLAFDRARVLGRDHKLTLDTRALFARWTGKAGNPAKAAEQFEILLPDQTRVLGPDHSGLYFLRSRLAYWKAEAIDLNAKVAVTDLADDPGIIVWLEMLMAAHLVGRPSPRPDRPWLSGLMTRFEPWIMDAVERRLRTAVEAQYPRLTCEFEATSLVEHLVRCARDSFDGNDMCDGKEEEWVCPDYLEYTSPFADSVRRIHKNADPKEQFLGASEWLNLTTTWPVIAYRIEDF